MARVFIPASLRSLTAGAEFAEVSAGTVRDAIRQLEQRFPGISEHLCHDHQLRSGWCVSVGGSINSLGLLAKIHPQAEVHFLPVVGGG